MLKTTSRHALLALLLFAPLAQGAPETASSGSEAPIDQFIVESNRANIVKLALQVRMAEFRFYELYNQLNTERDYAVNCVDEPSTGSRFTWDNCRPVFQDKAQTSEAQSFGRVLQGANSTPRGGAAVPSTPGAPASMAISVECRTLLL
jgi:hypothetical protein